MAKTVEEMLNELSENGVQIRLYSPLALSRYSSEWDIDMIKEGEGLSLKVNKKADSLSEVVLKAYDEWNNALRKGVAERLGMMLIEHQEEEKQEEEIKEVEVEEEEIIGRPFNPPPFAEEPIFPPSPSPDTTGTVAQEDAVEEWDRLHPKTLDF